MPRISLATVYRNLEILTQVGLIAKREVSGRQKRFDGDVTDHDHIFCVQCYRLDNLHLNREEIGHLPADLVDGYTVTGYRLEFAGVCRDCRKKNEEKKEMERWNADVHAVRNH